MSSPLSYLGKNRNPKDIIAKRAPTTNDVGYQLLQRWLDTSVATPVVYTHVGGGVWQYGGNALATTTSPGIVTINDSVTMAGATDDNVPTSLAIKTYADNLDFVKSLTGDSGGATFSTEGNIDIVGGTNIATAGTGALVPLPGQSGKITLNLDAAIDLATSVTSPIYQMNGGAVTDFIGQATLVAGTVTVANTNIAAGDRILVTRYALNGSPALGHLITTISASTSFTVAAYTSAGAAETTDVSSVDYFIVRQS